MNRPGLYRRRERIQCSKSAIPDAILATSKQDVFGTEYAVVDYARLEPRRGCACRVGDAMRPGNLCGMRWVVQVRVPCAAGPGRRATARETMDEWN